ncbi:MAG: LysR family transcriptional regulator, partial [Polyangiaceae bacterium]
MDQLLAIRAFARVVETGNFTRAADSLQMPKATVSKLVQMLEAHLGVQLLVRTTRQVGVTVDGAAYYQNSTRVVRDLEDVDSSVAAARGRPRGQIKVNVAASVASSVILPQLSAFQDRYPDIRLDFGVSDREVDLISDNADCVIRGNVVTDASLISRVIGRASWITCATPAYLARYGVPTRPAELGKTH